MLSSSSSGEAASRTLSGSPALIGFAVGSLMIQQTVRLNLLVWHFRFLLFVTCLGEFRSTRDGIARWRVRRRFRRAQDVLNEVNAAAGMCRVSVRSASDGMHGAVAKLIAAQLGTQAGAPRVGQVGSGAATGRLGARGPARARPALVRLPGV